MATYLFLAVMVIALLLAFGLWVRVKRAIREARVAAEELLNAQKKMDKIGAIYEKLEIGANKEIAQLSRENEMLKRQLEEMRRG